jgi:hypothetical protein
MRIFLPILLLIISAWAKSQSATPSLRVDFTDCRNEKERWLRRDPALKVFRLPENTLAYQFQLSRRSRDSSYALFTDFKPGIYLVQYTNFFGETITRKYSLNDCGPNKISICLDKLEKEPLNALNGLKDGDSIIINFSSRGCFHFSSERLIIVRNKHEFTAIMESYDPFDTAVRKKKRQLVHRVMGPAHRAAFTRFENEIQLANDGGCTTVDYYEIIVGKEEAKKYSDGSCLWRGFYFLTQALLKEDYSRWTFPLGYEPE